MIIKNIIKRIKHVGITSAYAITIGIAVVACGATNPPTISEGHIKSTPDDKVADKASIPQQIGRASCRERV